MFYVNTKCSKIFTLRIFPISENCSQRYKINNADKNNQYLSIIEFVLFDEYVRCFFR